MSTCTTCQPVPDCYEGYRRYSLQDDNYLFVLNCPAGFDCSGVEPIAVKCCDGTELRVVIPKSSTDELRATIMRGMMDEYARRLPFCDDPPLPPPTGGGGTDEDTGTPVRYSLYYNRPQECFSECPNGTQFRYVVRAGYYLAPSQEQADAAAKKLACALAKQHRVCLSALPDTCCLGSAFSEQVKLSNAGGFSSWSISSGTLPPGLTLTEGWQNGPVATISGTPTTAGTYTFKLRGVAADDCWMERQYTLCVIGITATPEATGPALDTLMEGVPGEYYSTTFHATACAEEPLSWQITAGALPPGLSLDEETGEITGIIDEDASGDYTFTVTLQTEAT